MSLMETVAPSLLKENTFRRSIKSPLQFKRHTGRNETENPPIRQKQRPITIGAPKIYRQTGTPGKNQTIRCPMGKQEGRNVDQIPEKADIAKRGGRYKTKAKIKITPIQEKRKALLRHTSGGQALSIETIHPDNFTGRRKIDITHQLLQKQLEIAEIQETHIPYRHPYNKNGCEITISAEIETGIQNNEQTGPPTGRVGLLIQKDMGPFIITINTIGRRIMAVALDRGKTITPIIDTYDPHKGYTNQDRNTRWGQVGKILEQIPKTHMKMWRADASRKRTARRTRTTGARWPQQETKVVGTYTYGKN